MGDANEDNNDGPCAFFCFKSRPIGKRALEAYAVCSPKTRHAEPIFKFCIFYDTGAARNKFRETSIITPSAAVVHTFPKSLTSAAVAVVYSLQ